MSFSCDWSSLLEPAENSVVQVYETKRGRGGTHSGAPLTSANLSRKSSSEIRTSSSESS